MPVATRAFVPTVSKANLGDAHEADLTIIIVDASQTPTKAMATVAEITAEITGVTDSRMATTGLVEATGGVVRAFWATDPVPDTDGAPEIAGWWTALGELGVTPDDEMRLLAWNPLPVPDVGAEEFPLEMPVPRLFAQVGDDDTPLVPLPDQEGHEGQVLTTDGTAASWQDLPAGGAVSGVFVAPVDDVADLAAAFDETPAAVYFVPVGVGGDPVTIELPDPAVAGVIPVFVISGDNTTPLEDANDFSFTCAAALFVDSSYLPGDQTLPGAPFQCYPVVVPPGIPVWTIVPFRT